MDTSRTTFTALIAVSLLILARAAHLHSREIRQASKSLIRDQLLEEIYESLNDLHQNSVDELMQRMNITTKVNVSNENAANRLFSAMDITCDFYMARTKLINSSTNEVTSIANDVLDVLGKASETFFSRWLGDLARSEIRKDESVNSSELADICTWWSCIKVYKEAKFNINIFKSSISI